MKNEYVKKYKTETAVDIKNECALQCALGCGKSCDSYIVEDNVCKFIMFSDTSFTDPNPTCIPEGPKVLSILAKKAGTT